MRYSVLRLSMSWTPGEGSSRYRNWSFFVNKWMEPAASSSFRPPRSKTACVMLPNIWNFKSRAEPPVCWSMHLAKLCQVYVLTHRSRTWGRFYSWNILDAFISSWALIPDWYSGISVIGSDLGSCELCEWCCLWLLVLHHCYARGVQNFKKLFNTLGTRAQSNWRSRLLAMLICQLLQEIFLTIVT